MVEHHEFIIKPLFDESLACKINVPTTDLIFYAVSATDRVAFRDGGIGIKSKQGSSKGEYPHTLPLVATPQMDGELDLEMHKA